jgi:hypothetical protein
MVSAVITSFDKHIKMPLLNYINLRDMYLVHLVKSRNYHITNEEALLFPQLTDGHT